MAGQVTHIFSWRKETAKEILLTQPALPGTHWISTLFSGTFRWNCETDWSRREHGQFLQTAQEPIQKAITCSVNSTFFRSTLVHSVQQNLPDIVLIKHVVCYKFTQSNPILAMLYWILEIYTFENIHIFQMCIFPISGYGFSLISNIFQKSLTVRNCY